MGQGISKSDSDVGIESDNKEEAERLQKLVTANEIAQYEKVILTKLSDIKNLDSLPPLVLKDLVCNLFLKESIRKCYLSLSVDELVEYIGNLLTIYENNTKSVFASFYRNSKLPSVVSELKQTPCIQLPKDNVLKVRLVLIQAPKEFSTMTVFDIFCPVIESFSSMFPSQCYNAAFNDYENFVNAQVTNQSLKIVPAIAIGPYVLYYNSLGLVIPRRAIGEAAFVLSEIDPIACLSVNEEAVKQLSTLIFMWNTKERYSSQSNNAQHFVDHVMSLFSISLQDKAPSLVEYLTQIRANGFGDATIHFTNDFRIQFKIKRLEKTFSDRSDLCVFCSKLFQRKFSKETHTDEYALLRNFDRIFWCEFSQIKKYSQIIENQQGSRRTTVSAIYDHEQPNTNTTTTSPTNNNFVPRKTLQGDEQDENLESHQVPNPFSDPSILCQEAFKSKKSWF